MLKALKFIDRCLDKVLEHMDCKPRKEHYNTYKRRVVHVHHHYH